LVGFRTEEGGPTPFRAYADANVQDAAEPADVGSKPSFTNPKSEIRTPNWADESQYRPNHSARNGRTDNQKSQI